MPLKLGLILSGLQTKKHIVALEKLKNEIEISGIVVLGDEKMSGERENFRFYENADELFEKEETEAVFISGEVPEQRELILKSFNNKNSVILEYPSFNEIAVFDEIVDKSRQKEKIFFCANFSNYLPHVKTISELLYENLIGKIKLCCIYLLYNSCENVFHSNRYNFAFWRAFGFLNNFIDKNPLCLASFVVRNNLQDLKNTNISIRFIDSYATVDINFESFTNKEVIFIQSEKANLLFYNNILKIERYGIKSEEIKFNLIPSDFDLYSEMYFDFLSALKNKIDAEKNLKSTALFLRLLIAAIKSSSKNKIVPV